MASSFLGSRQPRRKPIQCTVLSISSLQWYNCSVLSRLMVAWSARLRLRRNVVLYLWLSFIVLCVSALLVSLTAIILTCLQAFRIVLTGALSWLPTFGRAVTQTPQIIAISLRACTIFASSWLFAFATYPSSRCYGIRLGWRVISTWFGGLYHAWRCNRYETQCSHQ